ncbi:hypothetical protein KIM322_10440 [Lactobacillus xylocopicola]|uniref:Uncharacterized protein n=1 Tax=Lactobacillus xylocopicola TaxID=2976676 RepID=A0ABM8BHK7_9LACO|nr:hypothetical protein KIM322_10440 [Lactobacillus xylocopicola]
MIAFYRRRVTLLTNTYDVFYFLMVLITPYPILKALKFDHVNISYSYNIINTFYYYCYLNHKLLASKLSGTKYLLVAL